MIVRSTILHLMDAMGLLSANSLLRLLLLLCIPLFGGMQNRQMASALDTKITLKIYAAEILESVIFRVERETGQSIRYSTLTLLPYKAKAREYKEISVREILDDQLAGTPIKYRLLKKVLSLYNAETGDYSTNILSEMKR